MKDDIFDNILDRRDSSKQNKKTSLRKQSHEEFTGYQTEHLKINSKMPKVETILRDNNSNESGSLDESWVNIKSSDITSALLASFAIFLKDPYRFTDQICVLKRENITSKHNQFRNYHISADFCILKLSFLLRK